MSFDNSDYSDIVESGQPLGSKAVGKQGRSYRKGISLFESILLFADADNAALWMERANRLPEMWQRTGNPDEKGGHTLSLQGPPKVLFREDGNADGGIDVNRHSTMTHYQRPTVTQLQEGGTGGEVSEILFFLAKSKRRPSLIYSMQIIPVCLSIVARRKGVSATRRGGLNWTPISLLVGHPCKLFHSSWADWKRTSIRWTRFPAAKAERPR